MGPDDFTKYLNLTATLESEYFTVSTDITFKNAIYS